MASAWHVIRRVLTSAAMVCLVSAAFPAWAVSRDYVSEDAAKAILTIEADEWCPVNCEQAGNQQGVGLELARKVFEPLGYRVNYVVVPWSQALRDVRSGKADAIVGVNMQEDPGLIFPRTPIMQISDDFYVMPGARWRYQGPHTLKDKRVGIVEGYGYGTVVQEFLAASRMRPGAVVTATGKTALAQIIASLIESKIDLIIEARPVMEYTMRSMAEKLVWAGGIDQGPVYLAFSPASPNARKLAAAFDSGVAKLKTSGEAARIYRSYGVSY